MRASLWIVVACLIAAPVVAGEEAVPLLPVPEVIDSSGGPASPPATRAALDRTELADLLKEAHTLFREANEKAGSDPDGARELYARAVRRFERVVKDGGIENGRLYYNIGNTYFRMKDLGRAILNYRRAGQYMPNDPNLHQNLEYARARRIDSIEVRQKTRVLKTVFFWHYDVTVRVRALIFTGAFALLWGLALIRLFVRKPPLGLAIAACAVVTVLTAGSLAVDSIHMKKERPGVILADEVVARKGDSETYEPSFKDPLHAGTEFLLVDNREQWYQIELADGRRCWVPASSVELVR